MCVALHQTFGALVDIRLAVLPAEALRTHADVWRHARAAVQTASVTQGSAGGPVARISGFARAAVTADGVETKSVLIAVVLPGRTLVVLCAGVIVNADKSSVTDAHEGSERVHTLRVLMTVMSPLGTLVDIFAVRAVLTQGTEAVLAAAAGSGV